MEIVCLWWFLFRGDMVSLLSGELLYLREGTPFSLLPMRVGWG